MHSKEEGVMAYYLTLDRKGKDPIILDIDKSKLFNRISRYKGNKTLIQEMDIFTMNFNNEAELRQTLINEGIIPLTDWNRPISIRKKNGEKFDKVMYDIFYQKDIDYFMNPLELIKRIDNKLMNNDFNFVDEYTKHFRNFRECSSTLPEVKYANNESIRSGMRSHLFDMDVLSGNDSDNLLVRMTKLLIYKHFQNRDGKIVYKDEVNYLNLHKVLAFVNNYDDKNKVSEVVETKSKTRKKKKNTPIDGQMSIFD